MRRVVTARAVRGRIVRIVLRIVDAAAATICAPWANLAPIALEIAARVAAMVNVTMGRRVRAARRIVARVRFARMAFARRAKAVRIAKTTVPVRAAMARVPWVRHAGTVLSIADRVAATACAKWARHV